MSGLAEFGILLEGRYYFLYPKCTFLCTYNVQCNTHISCPSFNLFFVFSPGLWRGRAQGTYSCLATPLWFKHTSFYGISEIWLHKFNNRLTSYSHVKLCHMLSRFRNDQHRFVAASIWLGKVVKNQNTYKCTASCWIQPVINLFWT